MARVDQIIVLLNLVVFFSLAGKSNAAEESAKTNSFDVHGMVFCDTCRTQFITRVSYVLEGATVELQCKNLTTGKVSFKGQAKSDKLGVYKIKVEGDHEDDLCQVQLINSPKPECDELPADISTKQSAMVSLTSNNGEASAIRYVNPLGFMNKLPLPECPEVLKELDMDDNGSGDSVGDQGGKTNAGGDQGGKGSAPKDEGKS